MTTETVEDGQHSHQSSLSSNPLIKLNNDQDNNEEKENSNQRSDSNARLNDETEEKSSSSLSRDGYKCYFIYYIKAIFSCLSLPIAALFESLDSTLGMFMAGLVFSEAVNIHSFYWSLGIAGFFGLLIWYYTYKLLAIKQQEEKSNAKKIKITCLINLLFLLTASAAGFDAFAVFSQQAIEHWNSSKFIAIVFLACGIFSLVCRFSKYYLSDLGIQISNPEKLTLISWFTHTRKYIRKSLQKAVFEYFAFGESIAHLLVFYIVYSDLVKPYLMNFPVLAWLFIVAGVMISILGMIAQYLIILSADSGWAAQTLDKKKAGTSKQIDNRFGMFGQLLFGFLAYTTLSCCNSSKTAFKRLRIQIKNSKIITQGGFMGGGSIILASIICTGLSTTKVEGSIPSISSIPAWAVALSVFLIGYIGGVYLGHRQWKAKNDAGDEVDELMLRFVKNFDWETDDVDFECIKHRIEKKLPPIWIATPQKHAPEKFLSKKTFFYSFLAFLFGAIMGSAYAIDHFYSSYNKIILNEKFYTFLMIGAGSFGGSFMVVVLIILAFGKKELLYKGELMNNINNDSSTTNDSEKSNSMNDCLEQSDNKKNIEYIKIT